jgi:NitT/TauT family transport system substrate-binding protein
MRRLLPLVVLALVVACGQKQTDEAPSTAPSTIRVGYFPNLTHAQALVGLARGDFERALGADTRIEPTVFNAGPSVIEAIFAGRIDLAYVGPNPAINGFVQSQGQALRIIAGATSAGAALVVRGDARIETPADAAWQHPGCRAACVSRAARTAPEGKRRHGRRDPDPQCADH